MTGFIDDPEQRWSEISSQLQNSKQRFATLKYAYEEWLRLYNMCVRDFGSHLHEQIDNAFLQLNVLAVALLSCSDEQINAHEDNSAKVQVLIAVRVSREAFHLLVTTSEAALARVSQFTWEGAAKETSFDCLKNDLSDLEGILQNERLQVEAKRCMYEMEFQKASNELNSINSRLRAYDDMNAFEQFFNSNPHATWDRQKQNQEDISKSWESKLQRINSFANQIQTACSVLQDLQRETGCLFSKNVTEEHNMIDAKSVAAEVFNKLYDMENCVVSTEVKLGVEEALRHVLELTYVSLKIVDEDSHVKEFKRKILNSIENRYGREKTEELKKKRQYINFDL